MDIIDWAGLARNALWIVGLSIALAGCSYTSWEASQQHVRLRHALAQPSFQAVFATGMLLFTAGLAWGSTRWWERLAWLALLLAFAWQFIVEVRLVGKNNTPDAKGE